MPHPTDDADRATIAAIMASASRDAALLGALERLDEDRELERQTRVFEAVLWQSEPREYWIWFRACHAYLGLRRWDAAMFCASRAVQMHPDWEASATLYRALFDHFRRTGDLAAAADVILRQRRELPDMRLFTPDEARAAFAVLGFDPDDEAAGVPVTSGLVTLRRLEAVMRTVFHDPHLTLSTITTADDVAGWDSITHAVLLMEVERAFGVTFDATEVLSLDSVGALVELIDAKSPAIPQQRPKLIVYGNCQAGALAMMLARTPGIAARFDVVHHDLWAGGATLTANLRDFETAGLLLVQDLRNWRDHPLHDRLPTGLRVIRFPYYYLAALWPFDAATSGHDPRMVRAQRAAEAAGEAFPFGFHDVLLARLREEVADPEERFDRYRRLAVANPPDLPRYAALEEARLLAEDARYGLSLGRHIVERYRTERLFHALIHPTVDILYRLAQQVLAKTDIDLGGDPIGVVHDYLGETQVPVHPMVIDGLGLSWVDAQTRYRFNNREQLTFEEYVRRYIAFPVPD